MVLKFALFSIALILSIRLFFLTLKHAREKEQYRALIAKYASDAECFYKELAELSSHYISTADLESLKSKWEKLYNKINSLKPSNEITSYEKLRTFPAVYSKLDEEIDKLNSLYIENTIKKKNINILEIDGKTLDKQQVEVVLSNEDRTLVIAGAGSGKTLTIASKVKYLCSIEGLKPEEILLISFTNKAADEMTERIRKKLGINIEAMTFHKLGLNIITKAWSRRPEIYENLEFFIQSLFEDKLLKSQDFIKALSEFFIYYLDIPYDIEDFNSLGELYEKEKESDLETLRSKYDKAKYLESVAKDKKSALYTLNDEHVKSIEETKIANFLFMNGVRYEYEKLYPYEGDDIARKAYHPDFYLLDYDIYLEHFGITEDYKCPWLNEVEEKKYIDSINWKRDFHKEHGTKLIETYSYYTKKGILLSKLKETLIENGVELKPRDFNEVFQTTYAKMSDKYLSEFIKLCTTFIVLFKSNGYSAEKIDEMMESNKDNEFLHQRNKIFLDIIKTILNEYEDYLKEHNAIDFSDMINIASNNVKAGITIPDYKYIIVDEYQDISVSRYNLLKAIIDATNAKLLCVGDDWQSIFRFAGSDLSLFTDFERYFGKAQRLKIERTYRNSQQLIKEASEFISKNPAQIQKNLKSDKSLDYPLVFWGCDDDPVATLGQIIKKIISEFGPDKSIMLLGRNNFDLDMFRKSSLFSLHVENREGRLYYTPSPRTPISFYSVHKSKGLEADNVILLNFRNDKVGFPNQIVSDKVLNFVLKDEDGYLYSEERRLFYVAITRTKNRTFVLTDNNVPSPFLKEFKESKTCCFVHIKKENEHERTLCPRCKTGSLYKVSRNGYHFIGCSNYPRCQFILKEINAISSPKTCPSCGGFLTKRKGPNGHWFVGCTNYPYCEYTEQLERD